jgi:uncharacterized protein
MRAVLVDAGPLVAFVSRVDNHHHACLAAFRRLRTPLVTTWMPVTEALHLLAFSLPGQEALLEMIERQALCVLPVLDSDLPGIRSLMRKYQDLPMGFADATLVHAAIREGLRDVMTLDHRDFGVYRLGARRTFNILRL